MSDAGSDGDGVSDWNSVRQSLQKLNVQVDDICDIAKAKGERLMDFEESIAAVEGLKKEIGELDYEIEVKGETDRELNREIGFKEARLKELDGEIGQLEEDLEAHRDRVEILTADVESRKQKVKDTHTEIRAQQKKLSYLREAKQNTDVEKVLDDLHEEHNLIKEKYEALTEGTLRGRAAMVNSGPKLHMSSLRECIADIQLAADTVSPPNGRMAALTEFMKFVNNATEEQVEDLKNLGMGDYSAERILNKEKAFKSPRELANLGLDPSFMGRWVLAAALPGVRLIPRKI